MTTSISPVEGTLLSGAPTQWPRLQMCDPRMAAMDVAEEDLSNALVAIIAGTTTMVSAVDIQRLLARFFQSICRFIGILPVATGDDSGPTPLNQPSNRASQVALTPMRMLPSNEVLEVDPLLFACRPAPLYGSPLLPHGWDPMLVEELLPYLVAGVGVPVTANDTPVDLSSASPPPSTPPPSPPLPLYLHLHQHLHPSQGMSRKIGLACSYRRFARRSHRQFSPLLHHSDELGC
jgi:hypothetical protein